MCKTTQYIYSCSHPATHRFRTDVCSTNITDRRTCRIQDITRILSEICLRCQAEERQTGRIRTRRHVRKKDEEEVFDDTWYIPSRCFHDVGFQTLNPFGVKEEELEEPEETSEGEKEKLTQTVEISMSPESSTSSQPQTLTSPSTSTSTSAGMLTLDRQYPKWTSYHSMDGEADDDKAEETRLDKLKPRGIKREKRAASPCCLKERQLGEWQATRLEGREDRVRGRIPESFCQSLV